MVRYEEVLYAVDPRVAQADTAAHKLIPPHSVRAQATQGDTSAQSVPVRGSVVRCGVEDPREDPRVAPAVQLLRASSAVGRCADALAVR